MLHTQCFDPLVTHFYSNTESVHVCSRVCECGRVICTTSVKGFRGTPSRVNCEFSCVIK